MEIIKAEKDRLDEMMEIYTYARKFMKEHGNPNQWGADYPLRSHIEEDIEKGQSYLCLENGKIACVFVYFTGEDPSYAHIEGGEWLNDREYGVVHRIASAEGTRGAATFCLNWCFKQCRNLRIDTHELNFPMQNLLKKLGFVRCGTIYVRDHSPRSAFQKCDE